MNDSYEYDVALSFAGEDRIYVRAVAAALTAQGIEVFFDEYKQVDIWGKDLYEHLHKVYSSQARYCVIFISEAYAKKVWTTHERKSAQERALQERNEYILPARFDNTELPGMSSTIAYVDLRKLGPEEFAKLIIQKLGRPQAASDSKQGPKYPVPHVHSSSFNPYDEIDRFITMLETKLKERSTSLQNSGATLSVFKRADKTCFRIVQSARTIFSLDVWSGGISGDTGLSFYAVDGEIRMASNSMNAWAEIVWDNEKGEVTLRLTDFSLFSQTPSRGKSVTFDEFVEQIWKRIVEAVDRSQRR
ncbi:MAG TPA: TIR domain-containing protein [Anaerolineales bacterium]|nr:TIR domain-containing protein [Anaerolineales bacterium]